MKTYPDKLMVHGPNHLTMYFIRSRRERIRTIAEIGVYEGDTSLALAQYLGGKGELHLYDFHDRVDTVARRLRAHGYTNVVARGCSNKLYDSYCWPLMKLLESSDQTVYDYIFLDGAHSVFVDGLAFTLCDRLLKPGGYIDFDDYFWTFKRSPALNPEVFPPTAQLYTEEQIETQQIKLIIDVLVRRNPNYREVVPNKIFGKRHPLRESGA